MNSARVSSEACTSRTFSRSIWTNWAHTSSGICSTSSACRFATPRPASRSAASDLIGELLLLMAAPALYPSPRRPTHGLRHVNAVLRHRFERVHGVLQGSVDPLSHDAPWNGRTERRRVRPDRRGDVI